MARSRRDDARFAVGFGPVIRRVGNFPGGFECSGCSHRFSWGYMY